MYLRAAASVPEAERTAGRVAAALGTTSEAPGATAQALDERHRVIRRTARKVLSRSGCGVRARTSAGTVPVASLLRGRPA